MTKGCERILRSMKTIAIIGGGFCGGVCARFLDRKLPKEYRLLLFDKKGYFEFTPSIHKVITDKNYDEKIKVPFKRFLMKADIILEEVVSVTRNSITTKNSSYKFDYLVLCTGVYTQILNQGCVLKNITDASKISNLISGSKSITIVGGGYTGTEIAGEFATKTKKEVILIDNSDRLLQRQPKNASLLAMKYLKKKDVNIILNESVSDKKSIECVIWCIGIKPNTEFLVEFPINEEGYIKVTDTLNVIGHRNIFAGGDISDLVEEKSAQTAEYHGRIIAKNILAHIQRRDLISYAPKNRVMVISLGDWYGILTYKNFVIGGIIPALIKKIIELKTVWKFKLGHLLPL